MPVDLATGETMIQSIGVIDAGQMGNGIAQVAACACYDVVMIDIKDEYVEKGLSETPSNRKKSLEGLCMGLFVCYGHVECQYRGSWKKKNLDSDKNIGEAPTVAQFELSKV